MSDTYTDGTERYAVTLNIELNEVVVAPSESNAVAKVRSVVKHALPTADIKQFDVSEVSDERR